MPALNTKTIFDVSISDLWYLKSQLELYSWLNNKRLEGFFIDSDKLYLVFDGNFSEDELDDLDYILKQHGFKINGDVHHNQGYTLIPIEPKEGVIS